METLKKPRTPHAVVEAILAEAPNTTINNLHAKHGIKEATIRALLKRRGVKPLKFDPKNRLIPKDKLAEILKDGWLSMHEIMKRCNCGHTMAIRSLRHYGLVRERKPQVRNRVKNGTRAFKVLGYLMANPEAPYDFIAKQFLCSREFVSHVAAMARAERIIK